MSLPSALFLPQSMRSTHGITPIRSILHKDSNYGPPLKVSHQAGQTSPWIAAWNNSRGAWKSVPEINKDYRKTVKADAEQCSSPSLQAPKFRQKRVSFSTEAPSLIESNPIGPGPHADCNTTGMFQKFDVDFNHSVYSMTHLGSNCELLDAICVKKPSILDLVNSLVTIQASRGGCSRAELENAALRMIDIAYLQQMFQEDESWQRHKGLRPRSKIIEHSHLKNEP